MSEVHLDLNDKGFELIVSGPVTSVFSLRDVNWWGSMVLDESAGYVLVFLSQSQFNG